ncbi:MAG: membrane protein insertion efficiency factor YidD [Omnitrophica WOR_2 bacterium RBG_13_44_8b]|nr:MAG: membrane protein insertion efficiency factor YidD [Omnitrophica WOR_2 bacterium RBG_13_44_8b]
MLKNLLLILINIYQGYLRRIFPSSCRFTPNCSEYAKQAILKYGCLQGSLRAGKRLLLCHPYSGKAGYYPLE